MKYNAIIDALFFNLETLLLMTKLLYIHGQSFLQYSLPVLMDLQHFVKSGCTAYYGKLIVTPLEIVK